jgi:nucleoid-associated protein YgaU
MSTSSPKKKKSIFQKAMDALTNRDAREEAAAAAEAAKQAAHDAELKAMANAQAAKMAKENAEAEAKKMEEEAARKKEQALADQRAAEERLEEEEERKRAQIKAQADHEAQVAAAAAAQAPRFIAEHTVQPDETLSHIALKYYGNATRPYWEVIHAANIETIPNAGMIKPGQVLNIPELPEELKKK